VARAGVTEYRVVIPGRPVPAQRMTQRSKWSTRSQRSLTYQRLVAQAALAARLPRPLPWEYVQIDITIYLRATRKGALPGNRGDWDNLGKSICDGIQYAGVLANDKAIIDGMVHIRPCSSPGEERAEVVLREATLGGGD